jgi:hypothetical protein
MFDRLRRLFGREREGSRPYERLEPEEIVEQYARGRARVGSDGWSGAPPGTVMQCRELIDEWERRGYDPNVLDEAADRVEEGFDESDLEFFE